MKLDTGASSVDVGRKHWIRGDRPILFRVAIHLQSMNISDPSTRLAFGGESALGVSQGTVVVIQNALKPKARPVAGVPAGDLRSYCVPLLHQLVTRAHGGALSLRCCEMLRSRFVESGATLSTDAFGAFLFSAISTRSLHPTGPSCPPASEARPSDDVPNAAVCHPRWHIIYRVASSHDGSFIPYR